MSQPCGAKYVQTGTKLPSPIPGQGLIMPRMRKDGLIVQLHNLVGEHPDFEVLHGPTANVYCFRYVPNGLVERQEEPEVQTLLDVLNEEIVQAVQHDDFCPVMTIRVRGRAAIRMSISAGKTLARDIDATFDAIARLGRLLNKKLSIGYETHEHEVKSYV